MKPILDYGAVLQTELQTFIKAKRSGANLSTPWEKDLYNRLLPFVATGKLLRGSTACFSYEMFAGQPATRPVINAAMALELTHSALLIHDDIMDKDTVRRGQPSLHSQYQSFGAEEKLTDTGHFGVSMALCGGDATLFMAFELLVSDQTSPQIQAAVKKLFVDQLISTCAGQMQDVYFEARQSMPPKKAIYELMRTKTASYTLALPLAIGAAMAEQPASTLRTLQTIGISAGTIFQIRDDELGVMGNAKKTGKPVGSDIAEGKKTLLYYYLSRNCTAGERKKIEAIFGNPDATVEDIKYVQKLVKGHDISQLLNKEVRRLEARAFKDIDNLSVSRKNKAELKALVRFCGHRSI